MLRSKIKRVRNDGKWTEGRYQAFITSALRSGMRRWPPKWAALAEAFVGRQKNKKSGRDAKHFRCAFCKKAFPQKNVQVDHIVPVGHSKTWDEYIEKLFCEKEGLQVLCKGCHTIKSKNENELRRKNARSVKSPKVFLRLASIINPQTDYNILVKSVKKISTKSGSQRTQRTDKNI